jgi:hypothetical protein
VDLNQLLFRHQVALIRDADPARSADAPSLAGRYACEIARLRQAMGAPSWAAEPCA